MTPLHVDPEQDAYALGGLTTYCRGCHIDVHRGDRRSAPTAWDSLVAELVGSKHG